MLRAAAIVLVLSSCSPPRGTSVAIEPQLAVCQKILRCVGHEWELGIGVGFRWAGRTVRCECDAPPD